ncbi:hypothetical protein N7539_004552 [Penicillium diatomitis]|uniref:Uncharacterized protein n=1 Tax=Penicillium diatomitis TaxID=2819901 RepID=A0A9W9XE88_9EURO|nr:uncharacterized protein N7539_004552 [Penicillium diatomitis]KAJ5489662.1 hypothetical protein N7539_004552 [Penicillium diatomitis]
MTDDAYRPYSGTTACAQSQVRQCSKPSECAGVQGYSETLDFSTPHDPHLLDIPIFSRYVFDPCAPTIPFNMRQSILEIVLYVDGTDGGRFDLNIIGSRSDNYRSA